MRNRHLRWQITLLFVGLAIVLAAFPLRMLHSSGASRINEDLEQELINEVQHVQLAERRGDTPILSPTWMAGFNPENTYIWPFDESRQMQGPPLQLLIDAAGEPQFRKLNLGDVDYLAYVMPINEFEGYITIAETNERDGRLRSLFWRMLLLGIGLVGLAAAGAWVLAERAIRPARQAVADQAGFLADAAHEMRTPLAVILASSSQSLARSRSEEEYVRSMSEIRSAAERASTGVNAMLDLVRFDSGQVIPRAAPLRLDLLAEEVAASVRPEEGDVLAQQGEPVVVLADMALLRQAVENVVRNATRRATKVELVTSVIGNDGVLDVLDDGPGFDPAIVDRVFERYQRGDRRGNAGIGLAIVRAIALAHGGAAEASNRPEGGARVRIKVPLGSALPRL